MTGGPSSSLPHVAVVLVHWQGAVVEDTLECLRSLAEVEYPRLSVVLVDNGVRDFPDDRFRQVWPRLQILRSGRNLGFTGGSNLGIRQALRDGADAILLLNNDTVVRSDLLDALLPPLRRPEVGIVGPIITYYDHPERVWFGGGTFSRWLGYTLHTEMDRPLGQPQPDRTVDFVTGCALLVRRDVFESVGLLWDALFIYFEDAELCMRAAWRGYRCVLVGQPLVRHKVSASMGDRGAYPFSPTKGYYFGRNALLLLRRTTRGHWRLIGMVGLLGVIYPYNIAQCLAARNLTALRAFLAGALDGLCGRGGKMPEASAVGAG